jgi:hypothetical protein
MRKILSLLFGTFYSTKHFHAHLSFIGCHFYSTKYLCWWSVVALVLGLYVSYWNSNGVSSRKEYSSWHVLMVPVLGWCWLPNRKVLPIFYPMILSVYLHFIPSWSSYVIASDAPFAQILIQLHHIWSEEEVQVAVQEEQAGANPQETQA